MPRTRSRGSGGGKGSHTVVATGSWPTINQSGDPRRVGRSWRVFAGEGRMLAAWRRVIAPGGGCLQEGALNDQGGCAQQWKGRHAHGGCATCDDRCVWQGTADGCLPGWGGCLRLVAGDCRRDVPWPGWAWSAVDGINRGVLTAQTVVWRIQQWHACAGSNLWGPQEVRACECCVAAWMCGMWEGCQF